jgi:hypothetical protein
MTTSLSRRSLIVALSLGTALLAACASPTAPRADGDDCISGTYGGSGNIACSDSTVTTNVSSGTYGGSGN